MQNNVNVNLSEEMWPFTDDFIFMMVMQDTKVCTDFLKMVLPEEDFTQIKIRPQENPFFRDETLADARELPAVSVETQKTLKFQRDKHGVRLDALAKGMKQWSSIEMQTWKEPHLGKRDRYYKCNMDLDQLSAGADYSELKRNYVIFICTYDPFGKDEAVYRFQSWDLKNSLNLGDDSYTIVLNTSCSTEKVPPELKAFYEYVNDPAKCDGSQLVREIDERVRKYNVSDWRVKRMRFDELRREQYEQGLAEGKEIGKEIGAADMQERLNKLGVLLAGADRVDDLLRSMQDLDYQAQLLKEFGL